MWGHGCNSPNWLQQGLKALVRVIPGHAVPLGFEYRIPTRHAPQRVFNLHTGAGLAMARCSGVSGLVDVRTAGVPPNGYVRGAEVCAST